MLTTRWAIARPNRKPYRLAPVLVGLGLALSACGSGSGDASSGAATSSDTTPTTEAKLADSGVPSLESTTTTVDTDPDTGTASDLPVLDGNSSDDEIFAVWQSCMIDEGISDLEGKAFADFVEEDPSTGPEYVSASRVCDAVISDAFGSFKLDPALKADLADRSVQLAACGRKFLDLDIPDDILFLEEDDPRLLALNNLETTPEQDEAIEACLQEALGDLIDDDGNLIADEEEGADQ